MINLDQSEYDFFDNMEVMIVLHVFSHHLARNMTNILLQEMMSNALGKILKGSEGSLVEVVSQLMDAVMWGLPIEYDVKVTRGERQNVASKDRKSQQSSRSKENRLDLIIRTYLQNK